MQEQNAFNNIKIRLFPIKKLDKIEETPEVAAEQSKSKKSTLKLQQEFINEIIANGKEDLIRTTQVKNGEWGNNVNDRLIGLKNGINKKEIPDHENPNKTVDIVEKVLDFNRQKKGEGLKILTCKRLLQRLLIPLTQIKVSNRSENLLNEMRQIIYSLHLEKENTKKGYNNIMYSIKL